MEIRRKQNDDNRKSKGIPAEVEGWYTMTRVEAVKMIMAIDENIGLPRAIELYDYLGCYGEITVTEKMIERHFAARATIATGRRYSNEQGGTRTV